MLQLPHLRLDTVEWGPPEGRPFLALHGWLDNANSFARLAPLLDPLRIVGLDLPGHGRSQHRPEGASYYFTEWVGDVIQAADALGWSQFGILAHSMGAGVAPLVAAAFPERVTTLVLIEGLGPLGFAGEQAPAQLRKALQARPRPLRPFASFEEAVQKISSAREAVGLEGARLLAERCVVESEGVFTLSHDPALTLPSRMRLTEEAVRAFLAEVRCPTLLIQAESGTRYEGLEGRAIAGMVHRMLPGGHHLHLEDPEPVAREIRSFLGI